MLQEYRQKTKDLSIQDDIQLPVFDSSENHVKMELSFSFPAGASYSQFWNEYVDKLSRVLCSFIATPESNKPHHVPASTGRITMPISSLYSELSIKWTMRVLVTVFPCIKACSVRTELPSYLR